MADETKGAKTQYRILKRVEIDGTIVDPDSTAEAVLPEGTVLYALIPDTFEGNVRKAAHEAGGDGDYAKVAARSFEEFPARATTVVRFT